MQGLPETFCFVAFWVYIAAIGIVLVMLATLAIFKWKLNGSQRHSSMQGGGSGEADES